MSAHGEGAPRAVALADQLEAAVADAAAGFDAQAVRLGRREGPSPFAEALVQLVVDTNDRDICVACPHLAPDAPSVIYVWAAAPHLLLCQACHVSLGPQPARCDRCGNDSPALFTGEVLYGPLRISYGLCSPCRTDDMGGGR
jgi:hypothetical protein